ncbi:MAG: hypothetical protein COW00_06295 [Bdellovibrio sp. CG12_big_fil_rev_8_21_14_0_65_39_13]|nr:MAG: hypothetical protein COW78_18830 [Bdellovibrio sp. CG22_combo_CG10-13_8_21_14_all_39_27]PIQ60833.1 MAG: hypothetical protein COW00_06295 [Bdellovibrio sp. CG12_big_fil_rev_8_21_14_0_65_39_13]PIR36457.1 MAG: hypothetical protein COV37_03635 [Bdellovibrio sp. CG11_big_fil_rev_8_21_14_0_20_39_38]
MKRIFTLFLINLLMSSVGYGAIEKVSDFDTPLYYPQDGSLKDLYVEAKIEGLEELLKSRLSNPNIRNVYFKIYWMFPGKSSIEIEGLKGFEEMKSELKMVIAEKLDYLIPEKFGQKFRSYQMTKRGESISLEDQSGEKLIQSVLINMKNDNVIKSISVKGAGIANEIEYESSMKRWASNKYSFDKVSIKSTQMGVTNIRTDEIKYTPVQGYGFPIEIATTAKIIPEKGSERESSARITFSSHKVNEGVALKYFSEKK